MKPRIVVILTLALILVVKSDNLAIKANMGGSIATAEGTKQYKPTPYVDTPRSVVIHPPVQTIKVINKQYVNIVATAYTADPKENGNNTGLTASGKPLSRGMIATPKDVPFGTKIHIDGLGDFTVEDRAHPNHIKWIDASTICIDIFMDSKKEALNFGVKYLAGYIIQKGGD